MNSFQPHILHIDPRINAEDLRRQLSAGDAEDDLKQLEKEALAVAKPRAIYGECGITAGKDCVYLPDGEIINADSVVRLLKSRSTALLFVVTAGREAEQWANTKQDVLESFIAHSLCESLIACAYEDFILQIERICHRHFGCIAPGVEGGWPMNGQSVIFNLLGDVNKAIGVELQQGMLMVPFISMSGLLYKLMHGEAAETALRM